MDVSGAMNAQMNAIQLSSAINTSVMKLANDASETIATDLVNQLANLNVGSKAPSKIDMYA